MADAQARIAEIKKKTEEKKAKLVESLGPCLCLSLPLSLSLCLSCTSQVSSACLTHGLRG
jgi:hypothetical protein